MNSLFFCLYTSLTLLLILFQMIFTFFQLEFLKQIFLLQFLFWIKRRPDTKWFYLQKISTFIPKRTIYSSSSSRRIWSILSSNLPAYMEGGRNDCLTTQFQCFVSHIDMINKLVLLLLISVYFHVFTQIISFSLRHKHLLTTTSSSFFNYNRSLKNFCDNICGSS